MNTWLTSDTHFGHLGVCQFFRADGVTKLRPWDTPADMDEAMVAKWNDRVAPKDKVYHLGDVVINRKSLDILGRLNGDKILIRGNHDIFHLADYSKYFRDIRGYHVLNGMLLSHIPVHEESLGRFGCNIHGHLHSNRVMKDGVIDMRYHSVCVEQTDFAPISFGDVQKKILAEGGTIGFRNKEIKGAT